LDSRICLILKDSYGCLKSNNVRTYFELVFLRKKGGTTVLLPFCAHDSLLQTNHSHSGYALEWENFPHECHYIILFWVSYLIS